jgi:hypothetical protein
MNLALQKTKLAELLICKQRSRGEKRPGEGIVSSFAGAQTMTLIL